MDGINRLKAMLPMLELEDVAETCGTWSEMKKNEDGVYTLPYISYAPWVDEILRVVYDFDLIATEYISILDDSNIKSSDDISDFTLLSKDVTLAVLTRIFRSERFCEGAIQAAIEDGSLKQTIKRLVSLADD
jgi:hypothetical protein